MAQVLLRRDSVGYRLRVFQVPIGPSDPVDARQWSLVVREKDSEHNLIMALTRAEIEELVTGLQDELSRPPARIRPPYRRY